jgi:hypothetical protein
MTVSEWADLAQNVAVIIASFAAVFGIKAWRAEFVGKRKLALAEEVLVFFYQARDAIASIRHPFGYEGEGRTRKTGPKENPQHKELLDRAYVLIERYQRHADLFARLHALRYRCKAWFGDEALGPFDALNQVVKELVLAARHKMLLVGEEVTDREEWLKIERLYYGGGDDDPISPRVNEIVAQIESICRPIIQHDHDA